jgi:hypothetical protein
LAAIKKQKNYWKALELNPQGIDPFYAEFLFENDHAMQCAILKSPNWFRIAGREDADAGFHSKILPY